MRGAVPCFRTSRLLRATALLGAVVLGPDPAGLRAAPEGPPPAWAKDVEALTAGVRGIGAPGVPGTLAVFGPQAFPVLLGRTGSLERAPVVAAARLGRGRVLALSHDGYGASEALGVADTRALLDNALAWAGDGKARASLRLGVVGGSLAPALGARALPAQGAWHRQLDGLDVLLVFGHPPGDEATRAVLEFVKAGGGLIVGQCGWGWKQLAGAASMTGNPWNLALAEAGLAWTDATAERTSRDGFAFEGVPGREFHAESAVDLLLLIRGRSAPAVRPLLPAARQASANAMAAWPFLPRTGKGLRARVLRLLDPYPPDLVPTAEKPLKADRPLERFLLAVDVRERAEAASEDVRPRPAAAAFPGAVPASARAVERRVEVDLAVPGWHSTGVYAEPGKPVSAVQPATTVAEGQAAGLWLQIGCHTDALWHLDVWPRVPDVTARRRFEGGAAAVASPYGGPVYVVVERASSGRVPITVLHGVEAPLYRLGRTTKEEWARARRAPAPWAELLGTKVALSVPSEVVRDLADPEPLMLWWDGVLDHAADLAARPRARTRPERYVADVEISAGYMHSGYPIMTHLDAAARMVDLATLSTRGDWGLFHELGHNHQEGDWTFDGTVEVTCNLFSLYLMERAAGRKGTDGHEAFAARDQRTRAHLAKAAPFDGWKADPFLALEMYVQLQEAFGWEPYQAVFAGYRALPQGERPTSEQQKRDQWMLRMSRAVERDLGPFFAAWGVPVSAEARAALQGLPPWMPPGFPPR